MCHAIYNSLFAGNLSQLTAQGLQRSRVEDIQKKDIELSPMRITLTAVASLVSLYFITVGVTGFFSPSKASFLLLNRGINFVNHTNSYLCLGTGSILSALLLGGLHASQDAVVIAAKSYSLENGDSEWFCWQPANSS